MKIAIVGPEESKWTEKQKIKAKEQIFLILDRKTHVCYFGEDTRDPTIVTLVSGHCPKGKECWYNITKDCWESHILRMLNPYTNSKCGTVVKYNNEKFIYTYDEGGIDTWAEIEAAKLGINMEIYPAEIKQWEDYVVPSFGKIPEKKLMGYKSRNIKIAKTYILYCIVPEVPMIKAYDEHISFGTYNFLPNVNKEGVKDHFCFHCNQWGHPNNGGCWTMKYAKKLGKETHLVVIK